MRALDEVAAAIRCARGGWRQPVVSEFGLADQFDGPITPEQWTTLKNALECALPPLEFIAGWGLPPRGCSTIWDLVELALDAHPDWEPPTERTVSEWRNAQIFAGVRSATAEAAGVEPHEVTRESRFLDLFPY